MTTPDDLPVRTESGDPWTRWIVQGDFAGWQALGSRKPPAGGAFWESVLCTAAACSGNRIDRVHCCGPGILYLGPLGMQLTTGMAQKLLLYCLEARPERYVEIMAPVASVYPKRTDKSPSGVALYHDGQPVLWTALRTVVTGGSDGEKWSRSAQKIARTWVTCCSKLLRDDSMDAAQVRLVQEVAPASLSSLTHRAIRWPRDATGGWWQYSREQQLLWAIAMVMGLENPSVTEAVFIKAWKSFHGDDLSGTSGESPPAADMLDRVRSYILEPSSKYPADFVKRFEMASGLLGGKSEDHEK